MWHGEVTVLFETCHFLFHGYSQLPAWLPSLCHSSVSCCCPAAASLQLGALPVLLLLCLWILHFPLWVADSGFHWQLRIGDVTMAHPNRGSEWHRYLRNPSSATQIPIWIHWSWAELSLEPSAGASSAGKAGNRAGGATLHH